LDSPVTSTITDYNNYIKGPLCMEYMTHSIVQPGSTLFIV